MVDWNLRRLIESVIVSKCFVFPPAELPAWRGRPHRDLSPTSPWRSDLLPSTTGRIVATLLPTTRIYNMNVSFWTERGSPRMNEFVFFDNTRCQINADVLRSQNLNVGCHMLKVWRVARHNLDCFFAAGKGGMQRIVNSAAHDAWANNCSRPDFSAHNSLLNGWFHIPVIWKRQMNKIRFRLNMNEYSFIYQRITWDVKKNISGDVMRKNIMWIQVDKEG